MKRIISLMLSLLMIASIGVLSVNATEDNELYAATVNFDNNDISMLSSDACSFNFNKEELIDNGNKSTNFRTEVTGEGCYSFSVDVSDINFQGNLVSSVVINTSADLSKLSVSPVLKNGDVGEAAELVSYKTSGYYKFTEPCEIKGIVVTTLQADMSFDMTKAFFCKNDYSAKFMVDNDVLPTTAVHNRPVITIKDKTAAISLEDDDNFYHPYSECKWPTIVVDENDTLYVGASGCRKEHSDPFGATVLVKSTDGGKTYSEPVQINNTIMDDRDVGLCYMGKGHLYATYFTNDAAIYLPSGWANFRINKSHCDDWEADGWDAEGHAIGGIVGTYQSLLQKLIDNETDYCVKGHSYGIRSIDYGNTWSCADYTLKGTNYTAAEKKAAEDYQLTEAGFEVPISSPHGPIMLSDGAMLWVGNVEAGEDLPQGTVAAYVSHDEGTTWERRGVIDTYCEWGVGNYAEPDTCETKDGVLVCAIRVFEPFISRSYDKGATWTTMEYSLSTDAPDKEGFVEISHGIFSMPNGDVVLTSARRANPQCILVYVSQDNGRTWSEPVELGSKSTDADMGYPSSAVLKDGTIVTVDYVGGVINSYSWTYTNNAFIKEPETWGQDTTGYYYFDENSELVCKDWREIDKNWYYFDGDGYLVTNSSVKSKYGYRLVGADGKWTKKTGWNKVGSNWYYVQGTGYLKVNGWMKDSRGWCYLSSTGVMVTGRAIKDTKGYCLVDGSGYWVTKPGWHSTGGFWYYVQNGGYLKTSGWMKDSKGWCFLGSDGQMQTAKSIKDSKGYCLVDKGGYWVTKTGWHLVNNDWYYVQKGGYLKTSGWMNDSKGWCYLDAYGVMLKNIAVKDSKGWVILDENGYWQKKAGTYNVSAVYGGGLSRGEYTVDKNGYIVLK